MGTEPKGLDQFDGEFDDDDKVEFGLSAIFNDLKAAAKKQSKRAYEINMPQFIQGNGPVADAIRGIGQFTAFDPENTSQPIITLSDQEADMRDREFTLSFADDDQFVLDFKGTQNLQVITVKNSDGTDNTHMTPLGSTVKSDLTFKISADEFERLAGLDFTKFNDDAMREHMNNATGVDKLVAIPDTFAEEFRLDTYMLDTDSDIRFDIKNGQITA